jgi:hypothetical protein
MMSRQYLDTARTLLRVIGNITDQTIADRLRALAEDYERRSEKAPHAEAAKKMFSGDGSKLSERRARGHGSSAAVALPLSMRP